MADISRKFGYETKLTLLDGRLWRINPGHGRQNRLVISVDDELATLQVEKKIANCGEMARSTRSNLSRV